MLVKMASNADSDQLTMDFYDDIDVDFGDKSELGVGDLINMIADNSESKNEKRKKNDRKTEIVFEDEVDDDECEPYEPEPSKMNYFSYHLDPDFTDSIAQEVSEVTGNALLNEQLELRYKLHYDEPAPRKKDKSRSPSSKEQKCTKANSNITKKSELRKEMAINTAEAESKINFCNKRSKNALMQSLAEREKLADLPSPKKPQIETKETVAEEEVTPPVNNPYAMEKVRHWLKDIEESFSEDDYYSSFSNTPNTTDESTYFTASASENETPRRRYRATSKRSSASKTTVVTPTVTDASIGFKTAAKSAKTTQPAKSKTTISKIATRKTREIYIPGSYNCEFQLKDKDFPAIR